MRILWILLYLLRLLVGEEETSQQVVSGGHGDGKEALDKDRREREGAIHVLHSILRYFLRYFHLYFVCYTIFNSLVDSLLPHYRHFFSYTVTRTCMLYIFQNCET